MFSIRITEGLRRYLDGEPADSFVPCHRCSPVAAHSTAPLCDACRGDMAEAKAQQQQMAAALQELEDAEARAVADQIRLRFQDEDDRRAMEFNRRYIGERVGLAAAEEAVSGPRGRG